mgnify:CR=1 FL=1
MVATNSTSKTKKGTAKNTKRSTVKKSDITNRTKPKEPAGNYNKPHNHNALIASSANDTLDNIRVSMDMIREIVCSDNDGMALSDDTKQGLFLHIENLMKALRFLRTL